MNRRPRVIVDGNLWARPAPRPPSLFRTLFREYFADLVVIALGAAAVGLLLWGAYPR